MPVMNEWRLYQQIGEASSDAFVYADREGNIGLWNAGATVMFGYSAVEAMGQSLDIIIPENLRARHWEGYRKVMATGVSRYAVELLATPAIRKDGSRISTEFSMSMVFDATGQVLGVGAIIRDVTGRWQKEKALRERLARLEALERKDISTP